MNVRLLIYALVVGTLAGAVATLFRLWMGGLGTWRNAVGLEPTVWWEWLVLPAIGLTGGLIAGWLSGWLVPDAAGGGIPDVIKALDGDASGPRLRFRAVSAKFVGGVIGIGSGLSLGREGPTIHIGAGVGEAIARHLAPEARAMLILAGAAGGMAAAFNTPLAAIVFAVEGLKLEMRGAALAPVLLAAFAGDAVARAVAGNFVAFAFAATEPAITALPLFMGLGAVCGVLAHAYKRTLVAARDLSVRLSARLSRTWHPAVVGLCTGTIGIGLPDAMGGGLNLITESLFAGLTMGALLLLFLARLVTTAAAYGSGAPGGYFGPTLVLGAVAGLGVGKLVAALAPTLGLEPGSFAHVGMGALLAGALHLPLTAILITVELTGQLGGLLPLMGAVVAAYAVSAQLEARSLTELLLAPPPEPR